MCIRDRGYLDVLRDKRPVGGRVAVIGAGGIGFDVSEYLTHEGVSGSQDADKFNREWGIDTAYRQAGGLMAAEVETSPREVFLLQRKQSKVGDGLGKTTGWIHRAGLISRQVKMIPAVSYERIDDDGLHVSINGEPRLLPVDHVVVCAGQDPQRELQAGLEAAGMTVHLIGGADEAAELDAKRAINQGVRLATAV
ncbi:UNVERIFIED_CONTAM: fadH [Trichonephila clavipes]